MANRRYKLYSDVDSRLTYNEEGSELSNRLLPYIFSKESIDLELNYVKNWVDADNITQYTGFAGQAISSSAVIDNDYKHVNDGILVGALSGAITSIEISGLTDIPLATGFIQLINAVGQFETVNYTAIASNGLNTVFTVSATLVNAYIIGDKGNVSDPALIKTIDIDETQKDTGIFTITIDANSLPYLRAIEGTSAISGCQFEHQVKDSDPKLIFVSSFDFVCNNTRDDDGAIPPPEDGNYYTKVESNASFLSRSSSNVDIGSLINSDDFFPVYNKDTGVAELYKISEVAGGVQIPPVENPYVDLTAMFADQANQTSKYFQKAGVLYYEYLGTTVGDITDYNAVGGGDVEEAPIDGTQYAREDATWTAITGGGAVLDVFGRTGNVVAVSGDYNASQITETATEKIMTDEERTAIDLTHYTKTGVITGGAITQNTSTTFDISGGTGVIIDYSIPTAITKILVTWATELNVAIPDISAFFTVVMVTADNTIQKTSRGSVVTPQERRSKIVLQSLVHASGTQIDDITLSHQPAYGGIDASLDYIDTNGILNQGNLYKANGANVRLDKASGTSTIPFINIINDILNPATKIDNAELAVLITAGYQDGIGGFTIVPPVLDVNTGVYDDGSGTLVVIPNNRFVTHRLTYFPDSEQTGLQYGQVTYATQEDAINSIYTESFNSAPINTSGSTTTHMTIQQGTTDFTTAVFTLNIARGGAGGTVPSAVLIVNSGTDIAVDNSNPQSPIINLASSKLDISVVSDVSGTAGSDAILNMISLTQAEYDLITPVATTFYVITDAV